MSEISLLYLPFISPMMPPLGIPLLVSFLNQKGINSTAYDLNIELYNELLTEENITNGYIHIEEVYVDFSAKSNLQENEDQELYSRITELLKRKKSGEELDVILEVLLFLV